jgi:polynucleotide 5'-hydroxyl-kinase GRC3/NOL9
LTGTARTIAVEAGKTLLIIGPASFQLREGEATVLAAPLDSSRIIVPRGKQTPIEIRSASSLAVWLGQDGDVEELRGSTIPLSWREAASVLAELEEGIAIVIGGGDAGKTTLSAFLANTLHGEGASVAVVDADIGQTDLGPPTTMAAGEVATYLVNLSQVKPSERIFIGLTSPGYVKAKVIRSVNRLVRCHARPGMLVIVNTDGWVSGSEAVDYKLQMLNELKPDIALGIGGDDGTSEILEAGDCTTLLVGSPDIRKERTQVDRRELRALGYHKYLAGSSVKVFSLHGTRLRSALSYEALNLNRLSRSQVEDLKGAVMGFLNSDEFLQEIGVLEDIAPSTMTLKAFSRITAAPNAIEIGGIRLSNDGRELGYVGL